MRHAITFSDDSLRRTADCQLTRISSPIPLVYFLRYNLVPFLEWVKHGYHTTNTLASGYESPLKSTRIPFSDLMIVKSTFPGHEGVPDAWIGDSVYPNVTEVDEIHNSGQHSVLTGASLDQSHLYTNVDTGPNFSASSILTIPPTSTVGQYEGGTS